MDGLALPAPATLKEPPAPRRNSTLTIRKILQAFAASGLKAALTHEQIRRVVEKSLTDGEVSTGFANVKRTTRKKPRMEDCI